MTATVLHGDCIEVLATLPAESVDSVVTDPPYHLTNRTPDVKWCVDCGRVLGGSDGKPAACPRCGGTLECQRSRGQRGFIGKEWDGGDVAFRPETWAEMLRVLKPGAHLVAFGGTRTYHRMACAIEDAGFEIRDQLAWVYGTGFCKTGYIRDPKTKEIVREGWAGSLKPAWEPIVLARKPLACPTVAANVLEHGTGALNIDATRVSIVGDRRSPCGADGVQHRTTGGFYGGHRPSEGFDTAKARWPANLCHDGSDEVLEAFAAFDGGRREGWYSGEARRGIGYGSGVKSEADGSKRAKGTGDTGTAARFFYSSKASKADRAGSKHPTVKPVALMRWLCRLVTPPGGVVLDPFAGSGTTGEAALLEGFRPVLIEREAEYHADILARLARHVAPAPLLAEAA